MAEHYTGDDYQAALLALMKVDEEFPRDHRPMDAAVTAVLDAVAPAIAARALREAAQYVPVEAMHAMDDEHWRTGNGRGAGVPEFRSFVEDWLERRADEIERR